MSVTDVLTECSSCKWFSELKLVTDNLLFIQDVLMFHYLPSWIHPLFLHLLIAESLDSG